MGSWKRPTRSRHMARRAGSDGSSLTQELPTVLAQYGFAAEQIESFDRLPQRVKNINFRVSAGGRDWILKCHTPAAAKNLAFSHRLELLLAESGFPVAALQRTDTGATLVEHGGSFFTLHAWVSGRQFTIGQRDRELAAQPALAGDLGRTLGTMHRIGEPLVSQWPAGAAPGWLLAGPSRTVTSIRRGRPPQLFKAMRLRLRPKKTDFDRWILGRLPELYRDAASLATTRFPEQDAADLVVAHNDLNWENLIFGPGPELLAVLDFDNATALPRALDIGAAAAVLAGGSASRVDEFLAGYRQAHGQAVDLGLVTLGMRWKCVRSMLWSFDSYLSGRVADPALVASWCHHLHGCLRAISRPA